MGCRAICVLSLSLVVVLFVAWFGCCWTCAIQSWGCTMLAVAARTWVLMQRHNCQVPWYTRPLQFTSASLFLGLYPLKIPFCPPKTSPIRLFVLSTEFPKNEFPPYQWQQKKVNLFFNGFNATLSILSILSFPSNHAKCWGFSTEQILLTCKPQGVFIDHLQISPQKSKLSWDFQNYYIGQLQDRFPIPLYHR